MSEVTLDKIEQVEAEEVKPYTFRLLGAPDIFLMASIISKIGIKEFKAAFEDNGISSMIRKAMDEEKENGGDGEADIISVGAGIAFEIASVILSNIPKCEADIYQLLAQTSNLAVSEIKKPGNAVMFVEMVIDFIKKEEFADFIKVVSKSFK